MAKDTKTTTKTLPPRYNPATNNNKIILCTTKLTHWYARVHEIENLTLYMRRSTGHTRAACVLSSRNLVATQLTWLLPIDRTDMTGCAPHFSVTTRLLVNIKQVLQRAGCVTVNSGGFIGLVSQISLSVTNFASGVGVLAESVII